MINNLAKNILHKLEPEKAHNTSIWALRNDLYIKPKAQEFANLETQVFGINFKNPVGFAAGYDKNAEVIKSIHNFGFGFTEVGTCTPLAQAGNAKPRIFRLTEDRAIINRLGFNNKGADYFIKQLVNRADTGIVGANIGKNKDTEDPFADYDIMLKKVWGLSDYITINISSPNTPNLRDIQKKEYIEEFLGNIKAARKKLQDKTGENYPILLKVAPDVEEKEIKNIANASIKAELDGLIISNTTISRDNITMDIDEQGGLSGAPLLDKSTEVLKEFYKITRGSNVKLIGVGGVDSAQNAYAKIKAGASLVQVYTGFIYKGVNIANEIKVGLSELVEKDGFRSVENAVGVDLD